MIPLLIFVVWLLIGYLIIRRAAMHEHSFCFEPPETIVDTVVVGVIGWPYLLLVLYIRG